AELIVDNVRVPAGDMCGEVDMGFVNTMQVLEGGRVAMAAMAVGIAQGALDEALKYMKQRSAFGRTLAEFNGLQGMIADMGTEVEAARLLTLRAALLKDRGQPARVAASMAKGFASEVAMRAANDHDVWVVVVKGAGRAFSSGMDRQALSAGSIGEPFYRHWIRALNCLEDMDKLVIAVCHGYCIGGGLQLAVACDVRLATED